MRVDVKDTDLLKSKTSLMSARCIMMRYMTCCILWQKNERKRGKLLT